MATRLPNGNRRFRFQTLSTRRVIGSASMPYVAAARMGFEQTQENWHSGKTRRRRQRIARRVASLPELNDPKWPKKVIFTGVILGVPESKRNSLKCQETHCQFV